MDLKREADLQSAQFFLLWGRDDNLQPSSVRAGLETGSPTEPGYFESLSSWGSLDCIIVELWCKRKNTGDQQENQNFPRLKLSNRAVQRGRTPGNITEPIGHHIAKCWLCLSGSTACSASQTSLWFWGEGKFHHWKHGSLFPFEGPFIFPNPCCLFYHLCTVVLISRMLVFVNNLVCGQSIWQNFVFVFKLCIVWWAQLWPSF